MIEVERAETAEAGVDHPQLVVVIPGRLVNVDVAGDMNAARQIAGVVFSRRLEFFCQCRHVAIFPDSVGAADREAIGSSGDAHRFGERSEMGVQSAVVVTDNDRLTRLIGGDDQADLKLLE
jgi:hypothetical protein